MRRRQDHGGAVVPGIVPALHGAVQQLWPLQATMTALPTSMSRMSRGWMWQQLRGAFAGCPCVCTCVRVYNVWHEYITDHFLLASVGRLATCRSRTSRLQAQTARGSRRWLCAVHAPRPQEGPHLSPGIRASTSHRHHCHHYAPAKTRGGGRCRRRLSPLSRNCTSTAAACLPPACRRRHSNPPFQPNHANPVQGAGLSNQVDSDVGVGCCCSVASPSTS